MSVTGNRSTVTIRRSAPGPAPSRPRCPLLTSWCDVHPVSAMTSAGRVFLARLAGIAVFDPGGDQLGKVRDAVTMLRIDRQPPRVLGIVVELVHRHRIFVPMGR